MVENLAKPGKIEKLGLKCGIEIHQQIDSHKLFCSCPSELREDTPDYIIKRRLRAVIGETGEVDLAAAKEAIKGKTYVYECYDDNCCLVELDEEPPHMLNEAALRVGLQIAKMVKAKLVDEAQVMRKTVVDGSNTTGFQRTVLIAMDGKIETSQGQIAIPTIIIEEDSARIIKEEEKSTTFRLDRLGIPLLEIGTAPEITSAKQCGEVAEKLGMILRSTGKVKRGIGTIRQDVNVSITGGERVEIKGAQELKLLPRIVELEAIRQKALLEIKAQLSARKATIGELKELTKAFVGTKSAVISKVIARGGTVLGLSLPGFGGLIGREVQPGRRLGTEFADRAKAEAGVGGILHSDELPGYGISGAEVERVKKELGCKEKDGFVLVCEAREKALRAIEAVRERALQALTGVPKEVRRANPDGSSSYLRPMPGAARMYPETDIPPVKLTAEMINAIEVPELIEEKFEKYLKLGLGRDLAMLAAKSEQAELFEQFVEKFKGLKPAYIAEVLFTSGRAVKSQYGIEISPTKPDFEALFEALEKAELSKESVLEILKERKPVIDLLPKYKMLSDKELAAELKRIVAENKGLAFNALIGKVMSELRGKAPGKKIVELLKRITKT